MTLQEAIAILNEFAHRGVAHWYPAITPDNQSNVVYGGDQYEWLYALEVIVIAEWYVAQRATAGLSPANSRELQLKKYPLA